MSSLDRMFKCVPVYFQDVNERAAHVKIDRDSRRCQPEPWKISSFTCCRIAFDYRGFMNEKQKALEV